MLHKTFISYKWSEAQDLRDRIIGALGEAASYYKGETSDSPDLTDTSTENTKNQDIINCREIKKVIRRRRHYWEAGSRRYYFFFEFTDINGKKHKFQFEKPIHEREVNVLKGRIEKHSKVGKND